MAYRVTREKKYTEELELVNETGDVERVIHVEITAGKLAENLSRKYIDLVKANQKLSEIADGNKNITENIAEAYENIGRVIMELMEMIFGKEDTEHILEFYKNDYMAIARQVIPFIVNVIIPEARILARENRKEILSQYNLKGRRSTKKYMRQ